MKKVLILYVGYGAAHKMVANYIEEYLNKYYKNRVEVRVLDSVEYANKFWFNIHEKLFVCNFGVISIKAREKLYHDINKEKLISHYDEILVKIFANNKFKRYLTEYNPDVVVSTMFGNSQVIGKFKKDGIINPKTITILTDFEEHLWWTRYHEYTDYFIVNTDEMKRRMINNGIVQSKIKVFGTPVSEKFNDNYDVEKLKKKYNIVTNKIILIFGGGGYGFEESLPYYQSILKIDNTTSIFIAGKNKKLEKQARKLSSNFNDKAFVYGFVDNVAEFMAMADIIVTKPGGLTVAECLAMNKPTLCINSIGMQETANAEFITSNGCSIYCKDVTAFEDNLSNVLDDNNLLINMGEKIKKIKKKNSIEQVCRLIVE